MFFPAAPTSLPENSDLPLQNSSAQSPRESSLADIRPSPLAEFLSSLLPPCPDSLSPPLRVVPQEPRYLRPANPFLAHFSHGRTEFRNNGHTSNDRVHSRRASRTFGIRIPFAAARACFFLPAGISPVFSSRTKSKCNFLSCATVPAFFIMQRGMRPLLNLFGLQATAFSIPDLTISPSPLRRSNLRQLTGSVRTMSFRRRGAGTPPSGRRVTPMSVRFHAPQSDRSGRPFSGHRGRSHVRVRFTI